MSGFDASAERKTLDRMIGGLIWEVSRDGGNIVSSRLQDSINDTWCGLTPDQKAATKAARSTINTEFLMGGNGEASGIQFQELFVPLNCKKPEK
jgi:hypothetical protein